MHFSSLAPTQLGAILCSFGALVEERLDLTQQARPFLSQLRDQANETVHFSDLDDDLRVVYLEKLPTQQAVGLMMSRIGSTAPLRASALGKAMAAFRPEAMDPQWRLERLNTDHDHRPRQVPAGAARSPLAGLRHLGRCGE
jgi:DNA-binding IclR family transcriptional regulator